MEHIAELNMDQKIFEVKDVNYSCLGKFPALCGVNLEIRARERISVLGANGSGKSSLLHMLNGLVFPQKGEVRFLGRPLSEDVLRNQEFNSFFRRTVGLVFQNSDIQLFSPTVRDEIAFGPIQLGLSKEEIEERVNDLLEMLNIQNLSDRPPYQLSGGEKKKVAIASSLAVNPEVLLLDEPTSGLDPKTQSWLVDLLEELHRAGKTIVTSTHDLGIVERISDRTLVLGEDHTIAAAGNTSEILDDTPLLLSVNLIHDHLHCHGGIVHVHEHGHFSEHEHMHRNKGIR
jgi:cobalt/nickel transport system ATP-binding protein